jgi:hypothetical protein
MEMLEDNMEALATASSFCVIARPVPRASSGL